MVQVLKSLGKNQRMQIKKYLQSKFHQTDELDSFIEEVSRYYEGKLAPYYVGIEQNEITGLLILDEVEDETVYGRIFTDNTLFLQEITQTFSTLLVSSFMLETPKELPVSSKLHLDYAEYMMALSPETRDQALKEQEEWLSSQEKRISLVPVTKEDRTFYETILETQYDMTKEEAKERFDSLLAEDEMHGFLVYADRKERIGVASCYEGPSFITLFDLTILKKYQGKGYGKGMLLNLLSNSLDQNKKLLLQVTSSNIPAFRLYQQMGFQITEQQIFYRLEIS